MTTESPRSITVPDGGDARRAVHVSVVVPTHNGGTKLPATLAALERQTFPSELYEVIVVDDGSSDGSAEIAEAAGARVVRHACSRGAGAARNSGTAAARAPIVAFLDDDCVADPHWLSDLVAPFDDPSVDGAGGRVIAAGPDGLVFRYVAARNPWRPLPASLLESASPLHRLRLYLRDIVRAGSPDEEPYDLFAVVGANMAFRTSILEELGGFDESYLVSEETELCRRSHARPGGARIVYRPSATVHHHFEPQLVGVLRRARWYGEGNAQFAAAHDDVRLVVFPFPLAVAGAAVAAALSRHRGVMLAVPLLPLVAYCGWLRRALAQRRLEPLVYPYLQLAQEVATMVGEGSVVFGRES